jgi:hypothetical protein
MPVHLHSMLCRAWLAIYDLHVEVNVE